MQRLPIDVVKKNKPTVSFGSRVVETLQQCLIEMGDTESVLVAQSERVYSITSSTSSTSSTLSKGRLCPWGVRHVPGSDAYFMINDHLDVHYYEIHHHQADCSGQHKWICRLERPTHLLKPVLEAHGIRRVIEYNTPFCLPYQWDTQILCVKSQMGTGKTVALHNVVQRYNRVLMITPRKQYAVDVYAHFKDVGFESYMRVDYSEYHKYPRFIIEYESLWRLSGVEMYDLVVIDECESVLRTVTCVTNKHRIRDNFQLLQCFLSAGQSIFLDADLGHRTTDFVTRVIRGGNNSDGGGGGDDNEQSDQIDVTFHWNVFKNQTMRKCILPVTHETMFLQLMVDCLQRGEHILIVTGSRCMGVKTVHMLIAQFPQLKLRFYHKDSDDQVLIQDFSDLNAAWVQFDVVIYTPRVTVGSSFEIEHFDRVFCYASDKSAPPMIMLQMIGRIRRTRTPDVYIHVQRQYQCTDEIPFTLDMVHQELDRRSKQWSHHEATFLDKHSSFNRQTRKQEWVLMDNIMLQLYKHNLLESYLAKRNYWEELKLCVEEKGWHVGPTVVDDVVDDDQLALLRNNHHQESEQLLFDQLPLLSEQEVAVITAKIHRTDASELEKKALHKHHYQKIFDFDPSVDGAHFQQFNHRMDILRNICAAERLTLQQAMHVDRVTTGQWFLEQKTMHASLHLQLDLVTQVCRAVGLKGCTDTDTMVQLHPTTLRPVFVELASSLQERFGLDRKSAFLRDVALSQTHSTPEKTYLSFINQIIRRFCGAELVRVKMWKHQPSRC